MPRFWVFQIAGWATYGVAMALSRLSMFPLKYMVVSKSILTVSGFLLSLILWQLYRRLLRRGPAVFPIVGVSVAGSSLLAPPRATPGNPVQISPSPALVGRATFISRAGQLRLCSGV